MNERCKIDFTRRSSIVAPCPVLAPLSPTNTQLKDKKNDLNNKLKIFFFLETQASKLINFYLLFKQNEYT